MYETYIQPLTMWFSTHPYYGIAFAFVVAFLESLAVIGTIIPGSVTLTAIGVLIGSGVLSPIETMLAAISGAVLGDAMSYWLGHHYKDQIKLYWPFRTYPNLLLGGEQFFQRHGGKSIFFGRFVGPVRSILPLVAGTVNMPLSRFLVADVVSAFLWAPAYLLPGIVIGAASLELSPETATRLLLLLLGGLIVIYLITWLLKHSGRLLMQLNDNWLSSLWKALTRHPSTRPLTILLQNPADPDHHGQLGLAFLTLLSTALAMLLAVTVHEGGLITQLNEPTFYLFQSLRTHHLDSFFIITTFLFDKYVLLSTTLIISALFAWQGYYRLAFHLCMAMGLAAVGIVGLKNLVEYARPFGSDAVSDTYSFPSGHMTLTVTFLGMWALLLFHRLSLPLRQTYLTIIVSLAFLCGFSRLYLGAHWLTDILGAITLGATCFSITYLSYQRQLSQKYPLPHALILTLAVWFVVFASYAIIQFPKARIQYHIQNTTTVITEEKWWQQSSPILPLYRNNRFGHPQESLNIQWLGFEKDIKRILQKSGWHELPTDNIFVILNSLAIKDKTQAPPVFTPLYRNQAPTMIFTKQIKPNHPIAILRLWPSFFTIENQNRPLWIGNIHYRFIWKHKWLKKNMIIVENLPPELSLMKTAISTLTFRKISYPLNVKLLHADDQDKVTVLLIRP